MPENQNQNPVRKVLHFVCMAIDRDPLTFQYAIARLQGARNMILGLVMLQPIFVLRFRIVSKQSIGDNRFIRCNGTHENVNGSRCAVQY